MSASQEQTIDDESVVLEEIKENTREEEADVNGENNDSNNHKKKQQSGVLFICEKCNFTTKTNIGLKHHQDYFCDNVSCRVCRRVCSHFFYLISRHFRRF